MKIDYPVIAAKDIRIGDTVLLKDLSSSWSCSYHEYQVTEVPPRFEGVYYLIDRPKEPFPDEYGSLIIAKKVRGIEFPDGVLMMRQRGSTYDYAHTKPQWKSVGIKISGADNHGEKQIEDWVLAKAVPVEEDNR